MFHINKNGDVDIIAEAELYFAYKRDEKAIEILKEASVNANPLLKSMINQCLLKNNKMDLFNNSLPIINSTNDKEYYKYRVHLAHYVNGYTRIKKFNIFCKNAKNTLNGIEEIESYIEADILKQGINDPDNWTITFISDELK
jgi:hypothetical protein